MSDSLKKMKCSMRCTRIFLHFIRNKPGYTNRYYYRFIEMVGPEKYLCSPIVRNEWDGARYSFDKMYGLVCAWSESFEIFEADDAVSGDLQEHLSALCSKEISSLKKHCDSIEKDLFAFVKNSEEEEGKRRFNSFISLKEKIAELERDTDQKGKTKYSRVSSEIRKTEKIIEIYKQLSEFAIFEKDAAVKNTSQEKSEQTNKTEEKKDGLSVDLHIDPANTDNSLPT